MSNCLSVCSLEEQETSFLCSLKSWLSRVVFSSTMFPCWKVLISLRNWFWLLCSSLSPLLVLLLLLEKLKAASVELNAIDLTELACKKHDLQRDHRSILQYYWRELLFPFMTRRHFCLISHRWSSTTIFPSDPGLPLLLSALSIKEYNVLTVAESVPPACSIPKYSAEPFWQFPRFINQILKKTVS